MLRTYYLSGLTPVTVHTVAGFPFGAPNEGLSVVAGGYQIEGLSYPRWGQVMGGRALVSRWCLCIKGGHLPT